MTGDMFFMPTSLCFAVLAFYQCCCVAVIRLVSHIKLCFLQAPAVRLEATIRHK